MIDANFATPPLTYDGFVKVDIGVGTVIKSVTV
jgi:hypothetical protein